MSERAGGIEQNMTRSAPDMPRLLDLFCGAGGCSVGYSRAGFDVVGVDVEPQPNYPFEFHQADAMTFPLDGFDVIHASPPCHDHSTATGTDRKARGEKGTGWMLPATLERFAALSVPWVVENVEAAKTPLSAYRFRLCGSSFGLDVRRHRWFWTNTLLLGIPDCDHGWQTPRFRSLASQQTSLASVVGVHGHTQYAGEFPLRCAAMGIDWMTNDELTQAIPPAYTEWIGVQLVEQLTRAAA